MGWGAARKLRRSVEHLTSVLAVELYAAARGIQLREAAASPVTAAVITQLRTEAPGAGPDRFLSPELATTAQMIRDGAVVATAEGLTDLGHTIGAG